MARNRRDFAAATWSVMGDMGSPLPILKAFRHGWVAMLGVHGSVTLVQAMVVAPLTTAMIHGAVWMSGEPALSDTDILGYLASPAGALVLPVLAAVVVTLRLLGYSAMLLPARAALEGRQTRIAGTLARLVPSLPGLLRVSLRLVLAALLLSLPFAAVLAGIHHVLLAGHDINYHLTERPPEFRRAVVLAAGVLVLHGVLLARLASGAVHALPLVIFQGLPPGEALRLSRQAVRGRRLPVVLGIAAWALGTPLAASLLQWPWTALAFSATTRLIEDPGWLVLALGLCFALAAASVWLAGFCGLALLALRNLRLYLDSPLDDAEPPLPQHQALALPRVRVLAATALGGCAITVFLCHLWLDSLHDGKPVLVIAHRGASSDAPENTLAAVKLAIDEGADWVEVDVQENAEGTVVVFHDKDFMRLGGRPETLRNLSDREVAEIDIGSWKGPQFAGERAPRLSEVLELCRNRAGVLIELKSYAPGGRLEERVVEVVEQAGMQEQVMVMSLDRQAVRRIGQLRPAWKRGLLSTVSLGNLTRLDVGFLGLNARSASRKVLREAERRGIDVHVWTVNDPLDMADGIGRGVDGLITDKPALAREVIEEMDESGPGGRLILEVAGRLGKRPPVKDP